MRSLGIILVTLALLTALPQAAAHQTVSDSTSTGQTDVWGFPNLGPAAPSQCQYPMGKFSLTAPCVQTVCPADIYFFTVRLELVEPSPGDAVALSVAGDMPALQPFTARGLGALTGSGTVSLGQVATYPSAVATYDDPVAEVQVQLGGCNRDTMAIVTGLTVSGSVDYTLTY